jgi:hypothetical protein
MDKGAVVATVVGVTATTGARSTASEPHAPRSRIIEVQRVTVNARRSTLDMANAANTASTIANGQGRHSSIGYSAPV